MDELGYPDKSTPKALLINQEPSSAVQSTFHNGFGKRMVSFRQKVIDRNFAGKMKQVELMTHEFETRCIRRLTVPSGFLVYQISADGKQTKYFD